MIAALSSFARLPAPVSQPVEIARCVQEALEVNPPGSDVTVETELPASIPPVLVDPDQMRIVIGNLLRNASDAMPQGGRFPGPRRTHDSHVELDVVDTGVGIPPEDLGRIMEPLYSTKARGLGLGLAIVRTILEKNQGSIRVKSVPGQGSTFTLRIATANVTPGDQGDPRP